MPVSPTRKQSRKLGMKKHEAQGVSLGLGIGQAGMKEDDGSKTGILVGRRK